MVEKPSNRQIVIDMLRNGGAISRPQVAERLGVSLPTAGALVKQLLESGLIIETGQGRSRGGRPARLVCMNPDYAHAVGLTISSNSIVAHVVDLAGQVRWQSEPIALPRQSPHSVLSAAGDLAAEALAGDGNRIRGIGVGISGVVDSTRGLSLTFPQMGDWKDVPVRKRLADRFGLPAEVHNEVQAATLAELHYGHGREADDLLYLHVGKGIGLGLISQGRVIRGSHGFAGEIGHAVVDARGPVCYCGNYGCLESVAGPPAIVRDAVAAIGQGVASSIAAGDADLSAVTVRDVFAAAESGDRLATNLLVAAGEHIGQTVANVANIFNPDALVLGGVLADGPPVLVETISRVFTARLLPVLAERTTVTVSDIRENACGIGAATAVFDRILAADGTIEGAGQ